MSDGHANPENRDGHDAYIRKESNVLQPSNTANTDKPSRGGRGGKSNAQRGGNRKQGGTARDKSRTIPIMSSTTNPTPPPGYESSPPEYLNSREAVNIHKKQIEQGGNSNDVIVGNSNTNKGRGGKTNTASTRTTTTASTTVATTVAPRKRTEQEKDLEDIDTGSMAPLSSDMSEHEEEEGEFEYIGSDLQMLKRSKPRRFEKDIVGLSHEAADESSQEQNDNKKMKKATQWSETIVINSDNEMDDEHEEPENTISNMAAGSDTNNEEDDIFNEAYDATAKKLKEQMAKKQKENESPPRKIMKHGDGNDGKGPKTATAAGRKYVGLTEFERSIPKINKYGHTSTVARGDPTLFDIQFMKKDMLDGPPFPIQPPHTIVYWLCRTCREISQRTKGKVYYNERTVFTIDMCKPCRTLNCEVRDCFEGQVPIYGTMDSTSIEEMHVQFPYQGQYTQLASAPFSLTRTEAVVIVMCEYCRTVTSHRPSTRDINGRCRITIDLCQKCSDVNNEISMSLFPTQAELNRQSDRRQYFAGMSQDGPSTVIKTHGKCVRD